MPPGGFQLYSAPALPSTRPSEQVPHLSIYKKQTFSHFPLTNENTGYIILTVFKDSGCINAEA
jgi:hypothetical protein